MKILRLDSALEPSFWKQVYTDIPDYYFFILDMKHDRDKAKITLALDQQNHINGMMMVYQEYVTQLRGNVEAVKALINELDAGKIEMTMPAECRRLKIPNEYSIKKMLDLTLMTLHKGEETLKIKYDQVRLTTADAEDIATLMRASDPNWWGEIKAEQIVERMPTRIWFGIKLGQKLVSVCGGRLDDWGSCINTVATHVNYRGRGYATSIVSALVEEMLKHSNLALIYVETKNTPAVRAYTNAGFKPYKEYILIRAEKR
jgi:predicted GNAT family acetyltransferase